MINLPTITRVILITTLLFYCQAFQMQQRHRYDFLNETYKPYCFEDVMSESERKEDKALFDENAKGLISWIPEVSKHMMEAIINLCNNKHAKMDDYLNNLFTYSISYSAPFIFGFSLLLLLAGIWVYSIFWKTQAKSLNRPVGPQLTNRTQISLALFAVSLLLAISVSIYGISGSYSIEKTINELICNLQKQDNGYLRQENGSNGTLIDFAFGINKFTNILNEKYLAIKEQLSQLQNKKILTEKYEIDNQLRDKLRQISNNQSYLSNLPIYVENITQLLIKIIVGQKSSIIYYNDTLEYEREVAIGFTFIKGNFDKYGNRFIGLENISKIISITVQIILTTAIIVSVISLFVIAYIIGKQKLNEIYYKYIIQYFLGVVCALCLIIAIFNSIFGISLLFTRATGLFLLEGNHARNEFISSEGTLNDPLVEIMVSFWPHSSGNMSHYGNSTLISDLSQFSYEATRINDLQLPDGLKQQSKDSSFDILKKSLTAINQEMQAIKAEMLSKQGLEKLDPSAFGRNIYRVVWALTIHTFNRCYEYRQIFGYLSLFLLIAILSTISIRFSYKSYIRTHETDTQNQFDEHHSYGSNKTQDSKSNQEETGLANDD